MIAKRAINLAAVVVSALSWPGAVVAQAPVRVVVTLPVYADLVTQIGGDAVEVSSIASPNEDAHFVRPKPSFALDLRRADMFVTTGLDLELWVPTLLDRAGNASVLEGGRGYVTAYTGIRLLDIPAVVDRSGGDIHIFGNPHLTTDPLRTLQVARNITTGLKRVAPGRAALFDRGLNSFQQQIYDRLFGARLVELIGGATLEQLALNGTLFGFLEAQQFEGTPLNDLLGGWLAAGKAFRGRQMICYHKDWAYFEERFGVRCAAYVESKPGIPPTPGHVAELIRHMREENIYVVIGATYVAASRVQSVANRGNAVLVQVPLYPGARAYAPDYFALVDTWVNELARAFASR